jgi:hypothetical protein
MKRILVSVLLGTMLGLMACAAEVDEATPGAPAIGSAQEEVTSCPAGQHVCASCNGTSTFCAPFCPECPLQLTATLACPVGEHPCTSCNGTSTFCGRVCPECAPQ